MLRLLRTLQLCAEDSTGCRVILQGIKSSALPAVLAAGGAQSSALPHRDPPASCFRSAAKSCCFHTGSPRQRAPGRICMPCPVPAPVSGSDLSSTSAGFLVREQTLFRCIGPQTASPAKAGLTDQTPHQLRRQPARCGTGQRQDLLRGQALVASVPLAASRLRTQPAAMIQLQPDSSPWQPLTGPRGPEPTC